MKQNKFCDQYFIMAKAKGNNFLSALCKTSKQIKDYEEPTSHPSTEGFWFFTCFFVVLRDCRTTEYYS